MSSVGGAKIGVAWRNMEKNKVQKSVFPPYLGLGETLGEIPLHPETTPEGASTDKIKGKFNSENFFNWPPNFHQNFWTPISPAGEQIFARSLHQSLGDNSAYKFGLSENFRTGTLKGSKLRGVNLSNLVFPQFLKILVIDFHQIWGTSRGPQDGSLCQKLAKFNSGILCNWRSKKFFSGGPTPKPEVDLVGEEGGICRARGEV